MPAGARDLSPGADALLAMTSGAEDLGKVEGPQRGGGSGRSVSSITYLTRGVEPPTRHRSALLHNTGV